MKDFNKIEQSNDSSASQWEMTPAEIAEIEGVGGGREVAKSRNIYEYGISEAIIGNPRVQEIVGSFRDREGNIDADIVVDDEGNFSISKEISGQILDSSRNYGDVKILTKKRREYNFRKTDNGLIREYVEKRFSEDTFEKEKTVHAIKEVDTISEDGMVEKKKLPSLMV